MTGISALFAATDVSGVRHDSPYWPGGTSNATMAGIGAKERAAVGAGAHEWTVPGIYVGRIISHLRSLGLRGHRPRPMDRPLNTIPSRFR